MRPTYIHLGTSKTASTSFQKHLFSKHSQIHFFGKLPGVGFAPEMKDVMLCDLNRVGHIKSDETSDGQTADIQLQIQRADQNNLIKVVSRESLATGQHERMRAQALRFKEVFGDCRAILFVREAESFVKSYHLQFLRGYHLNHHRIKIKWTRHFPEPPCLIDINDWLDVQWNHVGAVHRLLSPADTADLYAEIFGKEHVRIFIFEELVRHPQELIRKLCQFMGIDPDEGMRLMEGKRENRRHGGSFIGSIRRIVSDPKLIRAFKAGRHIDKIRMLTKSKQTGDDGSVALNPLWLEKIHSVSMPQYRRLEADWGLKLADYGYRL